MKNDKILIRTVAGLGVDSATSYLNFLVNKDAEMLLFTNNRSKNSGVTGQLFKTTYINNAADKEALGAEEITFADRDVVKDHLYKKYLSIDIPLKIVPSHYKDLDYDYIFDEFLKIDIVPTEQHLVKLFLLFFQKFSCHAQNPRETKYDGSVSLIPFYDYNDPISKYPLQAKLKSIIKSNDEGRSSVKIPLLATYFAEQGREDNDYEFFFTKTYMRLVKYINVDKRFKTDLMVEADKYLFSESTEALESITDYYKECFNEEEFAFIRRYNLQKVFGNHEIIENYKYHESIDTLDHSSRIKWLIDTCVPVYEKYKEECGYK